ncbi:hypothetical protein [Desulfogranum japonicum]|uniref:hypothetical protein n=1 Tax=Desulfogranum japonicum TaxID=231447 RepID=UPI00041B3D06|nr:hypothetical protein [Desulfogranum japonicum]
MDHKESKLTRIATAFEAVRKILFNSILIIIVLLVLAALGRFFVAQNIEDSRHAVVREKPVVEPIPWNEVDRAVAEALADARQHAELFAGDQLDRWLELLMKRVDTDFLEWYFSYWTQQVLGMKALGQSGMHYVFENQPTAAEKMTQDIQEEFSQRVLRPQQAELELERIVRETVKQYVARLRQQIEIVPDTFSIPRAEWDRYMNGLVLTVSNTDADRTIPLSLKTVVASGSGGVVVLTSKMKALVTKVSTKVMAKSAGKAASQMAVKTGGKVVAKAGGKFLGIIVGVAVISWDVWDHNTTKRENWPVLRQSLFEYFISLKEIFLNDPEAGMMATFNDLEKQVLNALQTH